MHQDLMSFFIQVRAQIQVFHWQTENYARHMAYGRIYDSIEDAIDSFIEIYQGKYKRIKVTSPVTLLNINDENANQFVANTINSLVNELPSLLDAKADTDLLNIRDEILSQMNQLKYLLTLK